MARGTPYHSSLDLNLPRCFRKYVDRESLNGGRSRCEVAPLPIKCPNPAINAQHLGCHVKHSSACHYCSMGGPA